MNIRTLSRVALIALVGLLTACGTTDSSMREQGHGESYVMGFHDGRHSGMKEAGNGWEHYIKDKGKFANDNEYAAGWIAGEAEGKNIQIQSTAVGEAIGGSYTGYQINKEIDKNKPDNVIEDVMKGVDTTGMDQLGK